MTATLTDLTLANDLTTGLPEDEASLPDPAPLALVTAPDGQEPTARIPTPTPPAPLAIMMAEAQAPLAAPPVTYVVDIVSDQDNGNTNAGDLSLREAIALNNAAGGGGTITFAAGLNGQTIVLSSELSITEDVTINGDTNADGKANVSVSGNDTDRVFNISGANTDVALESITLKNGYAKTLYNEQVVANNGFYHFGGAIYAKGRSLSLDRVTVKDSLCTRVGGAIYSSGELTIRNSTLSNNSADYGGALIQSGQQVTIVNSTFANCNGFQSVVALLGSQSTINSSTFFGLSSGNPIQVVGGSLSFQNSVIAGSSYTGRTPIDLAKLGGATITVTHSAIENDGSNLITDGVNGNIEGKTAAELHLGSLSDNGGPVRTVAISDVSSALTDAGDNTLVPNGLTSDAAGQTRVTGSHVDIGAFEFQQSTNAAPVFTSGDTFAMDENTTAVDQMQATDGDSDPLTYSLTTNNATNNDLFDINPTTGVLTFKAAPDFETPKDINPNNTYEVEIAVSDTHVTVTKSIHVEVLDKPDTIVVTTENDVIDFNDGVTSLREAILVANLGPAQDTITFATGLKDKTILLTQGELALIEDVTINGDITGDKKADISISGNDSSRIFSNSAQVANLESLNLLHGKQYGSGANGNGGAISNVAGSLTLLYSTVSDSLAKQGGAVANLGTGNVNIVGSTLSNNTATHGGGAVSSNSTLMMTNTTVAGNTSGENGVVAATGGTVTIATSTISGNTADSTFYARGLSTLNLSNSILVGNTIRSDIDLDSTSENAIVVANSLAVEKDIEFSLAGATNVVYGYTAVGLALGPLADNGGPVQTIAITSAASPLVNAGNNGLVSEAISLDANGHDRFEGGTVDIGATEYVPAGGGGGGGGSVGGSGFAIITGQTPGDGGSGVLGHHGHFGAGMVRVNNPGDGPLHFAIVKGLDGKAFTIDPDTGVLRFKHLPDARHPGDSDGDNVYRIKVTATDGKHTSTEILTVKVENGPSPIIVTTEKDVVDAHDGLTSLREAVALAEKKANASFITFADHLKGKEIVLTGGQLGITKKLEIVGDVDGDGKADITISGNDASRIFDISGAKTQVRIESLTLTHGFTADGTPEDGGAIRLSGGGKLTLVGSTIEDSNGQNGGAVYADGRLVVANSLFLGNGAEDGGAIALAAGASGQIVNTTFTSNHATGDGGALHLGKDASLMLGHVTAIENSADGAGGGLAAEGGSVRVLNTVIAQNDAADGADVSGSIEALHSVFGSDVGGVRGGTRDGNQEGVTDLDLGPLLDNGGPVLTFSPRDGSLLIDIGGLHLVRDIADLDRDGTLRDLLSLDGRDLLRLFGASSDVGAVEYVPDEVISGGSLDDRISGGRGHDILDGGQGHDVLKGGKGADSFILHLGKGADRIADFEPERDTLWLSRAGTGLAKGDLDQDLFALDDAQGPEDRLVYDTETGQLFFDADGSGGGAARLIAVLAGHPPLTAADILVI